MNMHEVTAEGQGPEAPNYTQQGNSCAAGIFLLWMFTLLSVPAGFGLLLAAVEPLLAALLSSPAEGVVVAVRGDSDDALYAEVRYEAGGASHTCRSWVPLANGGPVITEGGRLHVYYPAGRPAEGFVCDWSEARAGPALLNLGIGLAAAGLTAAMFRLAAGSPAGGPRRFGRWAAKALTVWLGCVLLGAVSGLMLLGGSRDVLAMLAGPVAGGALGGLLALRDAWRAHAA